MFVDETLFFFQMLSKEIVLLITVASSFILLQVFLSPRLPFTSCPAKEQGQEVGRLSGLKGKVFKTFDDNLCYRRTGQRKCLPG